MKTKRIKVKKVKGRAGIDYNRPEKFNEKK